MGSASLPAAAPSAVSLELWERNPNPAAATPPTGNLLTVLDGSSASQSLGLKIDSSGHAVGWVKVAGTTYSQVGQFDVGEGAWHHLVMTYDESTLALYVDGQLDGSQPLSGTVSWPTNPVVNVANTFNCGRCEYAGNYDEVAVYTHALSAADIAAHHDAAGSYPVGCSSSDLYSGLVCSQKPVGYWRLGESSSSQTAVDQTSLANGGSYTGPYRPAPTLGVTGAVNEPNTAIQVAKDESMWAPLDPYGHYSTPSASLVAWVKAPTVTTYAGQLVSVGGTYDRMGLNVDPTTRLAHGYIRLATSSTYTLTGSAVIADGAWHLLALTYDQQTAKLWVDGQLVASLVQAGRLNTCEYECAVNAGEPYNCSACVDVGAVIDELAVYDRAVTGAELRSLYNMVGPRADEMRAGGSPSSIHRPCQCGDPVQTATGDFYETATDLRVTGRGFPLEFTRTYDAQTTSTSGPLGYGWSTNTATAVTATASVVTITQENGSLLRFYADGAGGWKPPAWQLAGLTHNGDGTWTLSRRGGLTLVFDTSGRLRSETDRNGYATTFSYDGTGRLASVADAANRTLDFGYRPDGLLDHITSSDGRVVTYGYDANGNLVGVTEPTGATVTYGYDSAHRMTTVEDARENAKTPNPSPKVTTNTYDAQNRVVKQVDPMGRATSFDYSTPDTTKITDPRGIMATQQFDENMLVAETRAVGTADEATWTYHYDPTTLGVTSTTDPLGHTWTATYDATGNQTSACDPLHHCTTRTFNTFDEPLTVDDALNVTTTNSYDAAGNPLSTSTPLLNPADGSTIATATTSYHYDDPAHPGDVTSMTDPRGKTNHISYDSYGQVISRTDPAGDKTTYDYTCAPAGPGCRPNVGWVYSTVSPRGNAPGANPAEFTTSYTRDDDGRTLTVTDPLGNTTTTSYDANGNTQTVKDANNHTTSYSYDDDDELTAVTRPDQSILRTGYDADGNVTSQTDGANNPTSYGYDQLNRVNAVSDPNNRTTSYEYDTAGRLTTITDPGGQVTTNGYDTANRLTATSYSDGVTPSVGYGYDNDNRRTSMSDGTGSSSYSYDSLGRLTATSDGAGHPVGYGYDLAGNATSITYPNGKTVSRGYDDAGRLTSDTDWNNHTTTFGYDAESNLTSTLEANGVTETSTLNAAGQTTRIADTAGASTLAAYDYTRDPLGLLTGDTPTGATGQPNETYGHSTLNQLTSYTSGTTSGTYGYNAADNLTGLADGTTQSFDAANQLTSSTLAGVSTNYGYNSRGDRTSATTGGSTVSYGYDQANRLTSYTANSTTASYGYNGDGLRTSQTVNGTSSSFTWDTVTGPAPLLLSDGITSYLYGPNDEPIEQIAATPTISLVATGSGIDSQGAASSVTATFSHTAAVNDQILVAVNATAGQNPATPAGYTVVGSYPAPNAGETTTLYRKTATGGETAVTVTFNQGAIVHAKTVLVAVYRGVDPVQPLDPTTPASAGTATATATSVQVAGITTTAANDRLVLLADAANNLLTATWTAPAGMTSQTTAGSATVASMLADQPLTGAGDTGTRTPTISQPAQLEAVLLALRPAANTYYYAHDQQDSTRLLTGPDTTIYATYSYDPYGRTMSHTGPIWTPLLYDGQYQDTESGLYYLRNRYYDPTTAQLLTRDPIENLTHQPYSYAAGDPLDNADPSGLVTCGPNQYGGGCADGERLPPGFDNLQQMYAAQARQDAAQQCQIDQIMQAGAEAQHWTNVWQQEDQQIAADQARADYYAQKAANDQWSKEVGLYNKYGGVVKTAVTYAARCVPGAVKFGPAGGVVGYEVGGPYGAVAGTAAGAVGGCVYGLVKGETNAPPGLLP